MMNTKIRLLSIFISCALCSCEAEVNEHEIAGTYVIKGLKNNADTLVLLKNGLYNRKLYSKTENRTIFENTNKWRFKDQDLILYDFLIDEDGMYKAEESVLRSVLMNCFLPVERKSNKVVIHYSDAEDTDFFYEKLDN